MKRFRYLTPLSLIAILAIPSYVAAQNQHQPSKSVKPSYRLVDLGTLGGPASYFANGLDGILNNRGVAVGWSNTTDPDPSCFVPNCIATHAFKVQHGDVTDLGVLPGGTVSQGNWISGSGLIVGFSENGEMDPTVSGFPQLRGVLWRDGKIVDVGVLPGGGFESLATAVNNRGQVTGFALNTVADSFSLFGFPTQTRAFLWQNGAMNDLGTLGGPDAIASFINDKGEVAGLSHTPIDPSTGAPAIHPFLWRKGKMLDLGSLGGTDSEPAAFNENGDVVGYSTLEGETMTHPFLWRKGHLKDLGTLGGDNGNTNWINDRGDVVGKADLAGPSPQNHDAVLWRDGKTIDLGTLKGDSCSNAYFVNSRGQIVGTSESEDLCQIFVGEHAFLWQSGHMIDLNNVIPPGSNLQLSYAVAINDAGEIAGFGLPASCAPQDYESCGHAYILIPCGDDDNCSNETTAVMGHSNAIPFVSHANAERKAGSPEHERQRLENPIRRHGAHLAGQHAPRSE